VSSFVFETHGCEEMPKTHPTLFLGIFFGPTVGVFSHMCFYDVISNVNDIVIPIVCLCLIVTSRGRREEGGGVRCSLTRSSITEEPRGAERCRVIPRRAGPCRAVPSRPQVFTVVNVVTLVLISLTTILPLCGILLNGGW